jgi:hypothetical protein
LIDKEVVVPLRIRKNAFTCARTRLGTVLVMGTWLAGCAAISQDVHRYYRQMAHNFQEAEAKAKADAETLEVKSKVLVQAGDLHGYSRVQKELARIKDWQSHCAKQRERFEKAAEKMEKSPGSSKDSGAETQAPSPS